MWKEAPVPKTSSIRLAVSTELQLVTDRQTDRHWATASTRTSIASRGKNNKHYRASL